MFRVGQEKKEKRAFLNSEWIENFLTNLAQVSLVKDFKSNFPNRMTFEVRKNGKEAVQFDLNLSERKSWDVDKLLIFLLPDKEDLRIKSREIEKSEFVLRLLEKHFFLRFSLEFFDLVINYKKEDPLIVCDLPKIFEFASMFALKSQIGGMDWINERSLSSYSREEIKEVALKIGAPYEEARKVLEETKLERERMEVKKMFLSIKNNFFLKEELKKIFFHQRDRISTLVNLMIESGINPEDVGETQETLEKMIEHYQIKNIPYHIFDIS